MIELRSRSIWEIHRKTIRRMSLACATLRAIRHIPSRFQFFWTNGRPLRGVLSISRTAFPKESAKEDSGDRTQEDRHKHTGSFFGTLGRSCASRSADDRRWRRCGECHTSGHIFAEDIVRFVKAIGPRMVVPIHTQRPDTFATKLQNVLVLNDAQTITLAE